MGRRVRKCESARVQALRDGDPAKALFGELRRPGGLLAVPVAGLPAHPLAGGGGTMPCRSLIHNPNASIRARRASKAYGSGLRAARYRSVCAVHFRVHSTNGYAKFSTLARGTSPRYDVRPPSIIRRSVHVREPRA